MNTLTILLDSAETKIRSRGFDAFSFADLAKDAGIRKASVHYHFPTKADLAARVLERYSKQFFLALEAISQDSNTIKSYVALYRDALGVGDQVCLCVSLSGARSSLDTQVCDALNAFHSRSLSWLETHYSSADHLDAKAAAAATLAQVEGAQILARVMGDPSYFDRATANLTSDQRTS